MSDPAKDQYQLPEGVETLTLYRFSVSEIHWTPWSESKIQEGGEERIVIDVSDLPKLRAAWEAEQREEVEPQAGVMHPVDQAFYDLTVKERDRERVRSDGFQERAEKAEKALAHPVDVAERAANLAVKRTVERDEANAALAEQRERLLGDKAVEAAARASCQGFDAFAFAGEEQRKALDRQRRALSAALQAAQEVGK